MQDVDKVHSGDVEKQSYLHDNMQFLILIVVYCNRARQKKIQQQQPPPPPFFSFFLHSAELRTISLHQFLPIQLRFYWISKSHLSLSPHVSEGLPSPFKPLLFLQLKTPKKIYPTLKKRKKKFPIYFVQRLLQESQFHWDTIYFYNTHT